MKNKVFLGGTCGASTWREELIPILDTDTLHFNPVVEDWTAECQDYEEEQKALHCNIHLYVITSEMQGVYSIAEVINSSKTPGKLTILHVIPKGFEGHQLKSLDAVINMVRNNGGIAYTDFSVERTATILNLIS
jgi:hypothetical protein